MVTRARIEVEGYTPEDCLSQLTAAFDLLYADAKRMYGGITYTISNTSVVSGTNWVTPSKSSSSDRAPVIPGESSFGEEVIESFETGMGTVRYKARRVIHFESPDELPLPASGSVALQCLVVTVQTGNAKAGSTSRTEVYGHSDANAWGVIWEALEAEYEPEEWWSLTADGEEIHPRAKVSDLVDKKIIFNGIDEDEGSGEKTVTQSSG